ncbi:MAG: hypothetical protein LBS62_08245 [Clostridiales bacterium]|jgi:cell division protein FtsL|nr:hypothetical protein [Clostridiales bacterium]
MRNSYRSNLPFYSRSSEAPDFPALDGYAKPRLPHSEPTRKPKKHINKPVIRTTTEVRPAISPCVFITLALIGLCLTGYVLSTAMQFNKNTEIAQLREELKKQQDSNDMVRAEISEGIDLQEIERIAVEKLGMGKPQAYQIIHVALPKESHVVRQEVQTFKKTEPSFIDKLTDVFELFQRKEGIK